MTVAVVFDNDTQEADLVRNGGSIQFDEGMESAVVLSLFTDARSQDGDDPANEKGWWGDIEAEVEDDVIGSRLWLVGRFKTEQAAEDATEIFAQDALQWMIDDGVAQTVIATAFRNGKSDLCVRIEITRPGELAPSFVKAWEVTTSG